MRIKVARIVLAAFTAALLAACAGGGGGGGGGGIAVAPPPPPPVVPPPPPPPPPPPLPPPPGGIPSTSSAEYNTGYAVADTKAIAAWQVGATGQGVLVAVIDDGVDATHPELAGRISSASLDINAGRNQLFSITETHGSELSSIIAGNFNNSLTVGLAYNATILAIRADNGAGGFGSSDLANGVDYAIAQGARVINFSLGSNSPSASAFQAAIQRATAAGIIVVVSAGNDGPVAPEVNYPGFLATNPAISNNLILVAGAHDRNGNLVNFSNRAGAAQNFYVTTPGSQIIVPDFGAPGGPAGFQVCPPPSGGVAMTCQVQGTSYSAPYLTGAVALVRGAFPGMTPQQVVQLIATTADDFGTPGVDAETGRGRLNLQRAFAPVGMVASPLAFGGADVPVSVTLGVTGGAFGDGVVSDPGLWVSVGFDDFGRSFGVDLAQNWRMARGGAFTLGAPTVWRSAEVPGGTASFTSADFSLPDSLRTTLDVRDVSPAAFRVENALSSQTRVAFAANAPALSSLSGIEARGHLGFAGADVSAAVFRSLGGGAELALTTQSGVTDLGQTFGRSTRHAAAARLSQAAGPFAAAVTVGSLHESGAQLGLAWSERLGARPDTRTNFLAFESAWRASDTLTFSAEAEVGRSDGGGGWLSISAPLTTSAFTVGMALNATPAWMEDVSDTAHGRLILSVRQPLRVDGGEFSVSLPTADAYGRGSLRYETRTFDPSPSGRELDVEVAYDLLLTGSLSAHMGLAQVIEPGHVREASEETRAHAGVRVNY